MLRLIFSRIATFEENYVSHCHHYINFGKHFFLKHTHTHTHIHTHIHTYTYIKMYDNSFVLSGKTVVPYKTSIINISLKQEIDYGNWIQKFHEA